MATTFSATEQLMLHLCYATYAGSELLALRPKGNLERALHDRIGRALQSGPAKEGWRIVWGPGTYRHCISLHVDNSMYVVQSAADPRIYAVAIRGTALLSAFNWLIEDFWVAKLFPWRYGKPQPGQDPRLAGGTAVGFRALRQIRPAKGVPGAGLSLLEFFRQELTQATGGLLLRFTGHSLGGCLATVLALWLHDLQGRDAPEEKRWDPDGRATLEVCTFASPTAGNAALAARYDAALGPATRRIWNRLDMVPHAWAHHLLSAVPALYAPSVHPPGIVKLGMEQMIRAVKDLGYAHVRADQAPFDSAVDPRKADFLNQSFHQHTNAYVDALGMTGQFDLARIILSGKQEPKG